MPTESITHSFVIDDKETAEAFIDILSTPIGKKEKSSSVKFRIVTDPEEIKGILNNQKSNKPI